MYGLLLTTGHILIVRRAPDTGNSKGIATIDYIPHMPPKFYKEITTSHQDTTPGIKMLFGRQIRMTLQLSHIVCQWPIELYNTTTGQPIK